VRNNGFREYDASQEIRMKQPLNPVHLAEATEFSIEVPGLNSISSQVLYSPRNVSISPFE
jgi:hypothetical protein